MDSEPHAKLTHQEEPFAETLMDNKNSADSETEEWPALIETTATGGLLPIPPNLEETTDGRTEMSTAESTDVERLCALIPMDTKESVLEEPMAD